METKNLAQVAIKEYDGSETLLVATADGHVNRIQKYLSDENFTSEHKSKVDAIPEDPKYTDTIYDDAGIVQKIEDIEKIIPTSASEDNKLADTEYVNSSISTATASFRGSFADLDELKQTAGDNNDYAFYCYEQDGMAVVDRYKHNGSEWLFEYNVNNSGLTSSQLAATLSGITAALVQKLNNIEDGAQVNPNLDTYYQMPSSGVPRTDLADDVQQSLDKSESALQSITKEDVEQVLSTATLEYTDENGNSGSIIVFIKENDHESP